MLRKIIRIDSERCNGCGLCASACHEGAISMEGGKARLMRDDYCDGLGDCLPVCPMNAISFEEREAAEYNEAEVKRNMRENAVKEKPIIKDTIVDAVKTQLACGCPGSSAKAIIRGAREEQVNVWSSASSQLRQWPVQIKLAPVNAPYFDNASLLVSADCAAYAYGSFHEDFMRNKITLIGCPKLDEGNYSEKLTAIIRENNIKSITVARMEVPCCGGIEHAVKTALMNCGKMLPWSVVTISTDGKILE